MTQDPDAELAAIRARKLAELQRVAAAPKGPVVVTDASVQGFVRAHAIAVIDCWAAWCGPCRMMEPVIDAMARDLSGRVTFGKLNVDENPATAQAYDVSSIPTLLVFRQGRLADRIVGAAPPQAILARLGA